MTAAQSAEAQARLNVSLKEIVSFFEQAGIEQQSIQLMENFIEKHLTTDFLTLAEGYGKCMAFISHDELISLLLKSYTCMLDGFIIERKIINKKLKLLKEDKKADPEIVSKLERLIEDVDAKKSSSLAVTMRLKVMTTIPLKEFLDPKFNAYIYYKSLTAEQKLFREIQGKKK